MLDPKQFFRINRQVIISLAGIEEMKNYHCGRVIIQLKPPLHTNAIVSIERACNFKAWLEGKKY